MARKRFSRNIIASSDTYKVHSHKAYLRENHTINKEYFDSLKSIPINQTKVNNIIKRNYFTKCFSKLIRLIKQEAELLSTELVIIE